MRRLIYILMIAAAAALAACAGSARKNAEIPEDTRSSRLDSLRTTLRSIAASSPGEVGIALLTDRGDTILINNEAKYPLMSVFKLHQAIALCDLFEKRGTSLDTVVELPASRLNPDTWSPMLKDHPGGNIRLSVKDLLRYTLIQSDNNASNYMFETLCSVAATDSFVATLIPRESFRLEVSEAEMWDDHSRCYLNRSSPLGAALLIGRLFNDSSLIPANRRFICRTLGECLTGTDRIVAPLADKEGVAVAHKTGSGFRDASGLLTAHNDVAVVTHPDGSRYTLAVLVKDFRGSESQAAEVIAGISAAVYSALTEVF